MPKKSAKEVGKGKKSVTNPEARKRGGIHPPHPRCPQCGKAMYKTMEKGKPVKKDDPWAFCRNEECPFFGKDQTKSEPATEAGAKKGTKKGKGDSELDAAIKKAAAAAEDEDEEEDGEEDEEEDEEPKKSAMKGAKKAVAAESKAAPVKGERHKEIEADLKGGKLTHTEIAKRNACSPKTVRRVLAAMRAKGSI